MTSTKGIRLAKLADPQGRSDDGSCIVEVDRTVDVQTLATHLNDLLWVETIDLMSTASTPKPYRLILRPIGISAKKAAKRINRLAANFIPADAEFWVAGVSGGQVNFELSRPISVSHQGQIDQAMLAGGADVNWSRDCQHITLRLDLAQVKRLIAAMIKAGYSFCPNRSQPIPGLNFATATATPIDGGYWQIIDNEPTIIKVFVPDQDSPAQLSQLSYRLAQFHNVEINTTHASLESLGVGRIISTMNITDADERARQRSAVETELKLLGLVHQGSVTVVPAAVTLAQKLIANAMAAAPGGLIRLDVGPANPDHFGGPASQNACTVRVSVTLM